MRFLLIAPSSADIRHQPVAPLGLIAIATYLNKKNHQCIIFDRNVEKKRINLVIEEFKPDIVGISVFTSRILYDAIYIANIAKRYNLPVIFGGVHASLLPEQVLESGVVDYVVIGEGEETTSELFDALADGRNINTVKGLAYKENGKIIINEPREFLDLTKSPLPDWSLVKVEKYLQGMGDAKRLLRIYSSKGCPGCCTFCYNQAFHKRTWRGRTPQQILEEVKYLIEHYNIDGIGFLDELWSMSKNRIYEICNLFIENNINISWYFNARVDQYKREDLQKLYDAGCRWILFGIESGSKDMLLKIKKGISLERTAEMFKNCHEIGISTIAAFMIGFPNETRENLKDTVRFALSINPTYYDFTRYMCYPGTELYQYSIENNLFKEPKTLEEWANISSWDRIYVNLTQVTKKELSVINNYFSWLNILKIMKKEQKGTLFGYIRNLLNNIKNNGFLCSTVSLFLTLKEVAFIIWSISVHPIIRKRYGLYNKL